MFGHSTYDRQVFRKATDMGNVVWIDQWITMGMGHRTASIFIEIFRRIIMIPLDDFKSLRRVRIIYRP